MTNKKTVQHLSHIVQTLSQNSQSYVLQMIDDLNQLDKCLSKMNRFDPDEINLMIWSITTSLNVIRRALEEKDDEDLLEGAQRCVKTIDIMIDKISSRMKSLPDGTVLIDRRIYNENL